MVHQQSQWSLNGTFYSCLGVRLQRELAHVTMFVVLMEQVGVEATCVRGSTGNNEFGHSSVLSPSHTPHNNCS